MTRVPAGKWASYGAALLTRDPDLVVGCCFVSQGFLDDTVRFAREQGLISSGEPLVMMNRVGGEGVIVHVVACP